jgi:DNA-binding transcriptional ArsR family regulator
MSPRPASTARAPAADSGTAGLFAALGDRTRLRLVAHLCNSGPASIVDLTAGQSVSRQAVTKHLQVLARAGLARSRRRGRERVWRIEPRRLDDARHWLARISSQWDEGLGRLKAMVEG